MVRLARVRWTSHESAKMVSAKKDLASFADKAKYLKEIKGKEDDTEDDKRSIKRQGKFFRKECCKVQSVLLETGTMNFGHSLSYHVKFTYI